MERLIRLREPAAVVALVGLGLQLVLLLVLAVLSGPAVEATERFLAYYLADPALLLLLAALVVACWTADPTPHARGVTIVALVLAAATLAAAAVVAVTGLVAGPDGADVLVPVLARVVPSLTAGVVALGTSVVLLRRPHDGPAPVPQLEPAEREPEPVDPQQQPEWTPDAAVGTVWRRAGDAASQRPATSWDSPGLSGGWREPDRSADPSAGPTRRSDD